MKLGQNFVKYFVRFLGNVVSRKNVFEIYWPLAKYFAKEAFDENWNNIVISGRVI